MSLYTYWRTRGLLGLSAVAAGVVAVAASALLHIPPAGVRTGAILTQPAPALSLVVVLAAAVVSAVAGGLIGGRIRPDAGVFAAGALFAAVSWHSGTVRDVFFADPAASAYRQMAIELAVYGAMLLALQFVTLKLVERNVLKEDAERDGIDAPSPTPGENALAVISTAIAYGLLCFVLMPTDAKKQAMFGTMLAAFAASSGIHSLLVSTVRAWPLTLGVLIGGIGSYVLAMSSPGVPQIGFVGTPGARALPLDHAAAAGVAALAGYWYSRRWKRGE